MCNHITILCSYRVERLHSLRWWKGLDAWTTSSTVDGPCFIQQGWKLLGRRKERSMYGKALCHKKKKKTQKNGSLGREDVESTVKSVNTFPNLHCQMFFVTFASSPCVEMCQLQSWWWGMASASDVNEPVKRDARASQWFKTTWIWKAESVTGSRLKVHTASHVWAGKAELLLSLKGLSNWQRMCKFLSTHPLFFGLLVCASLQRSPGNIFSTWTLLRSSFIRMEGEGGGGVVSFSQTHPF